MKFIRVGQWILILHFILKKFLMRIFVEKL